MASLYRQHTESTGQVFEDGAIQKAYSWTQGQPWLVNALARECVEKILGNSYSWPVTEELIDQAAENIILRRDTHIDSLLERLKEERVKKVIQPVLLGSLEYNMVDDDTMYCIDGNYNYVWVYCVFVSLRETVYVLFFVEVDEKKNRLLELEAKLSPARRKIWSSIKEGYEEVELIEQGKLKKSFSMSYNLIIPRFLTGM